MNPETGEIKQFKDLNPQEKKTWHRLSEKNANQLKGMEPKKRLKWFLSAKEQEAAVNAELNKYRAKRDSRKAMQKKSRKRNRP